MKASMAKKIKWLSPALRDYIRDHPGCRSKELAEHVRSVARSQDRSQGTRTDIHSKHIHYVIQAVLPEVIVRNDHRGKYYALQGAPVPKLLNEKKQIKARKITDEEKGEFIRLLSDSRYEKKYEAIRLSAEEGASPSRIGEKVGVTSTTVSKWIHRFNDGGVEALRWGGSKPKIIMEEPPPGMDPSDSMHHPSPKITYEDLSVDEIIRFTEFLTDGDPWRQVTMLIAPRVVNE